MVIRADTASKGESTEATRAEANSGKSTNVRSIARVTYPLLSDSVRFLLPFRPRRGAGRFVPKLTFYTTLGTPKIKLGLYSLL